VDRAQGRFPFAPEPTTTGIRDATRTGRPHPIKGWFVHGTNPLQALPSRRETIAAIEELEMLAVCDILPTETTRYADVLLPEDVYLERYDDLILGAGQQPFVALRQPVVPSPYETRPAWRIAKELGERLGVGDFFAFESFEEYLETRLAGSGITLEQLQREGVVTVARRTPLYLEPDAPFTFRTPSGKIELDSPQLAAAGFDRLPVPGRLAPPPPGRFRLLYGRSPLQSFARTQNNPLLHDLEPENALWMHPAAAEEQGLADSQRVLVRNERDDETGPLPLKLTERVPVDAVYLIHGFGQQAPGLSRAHARGGNAAALIDHYAVDPICGSTGMRVTFVSVRAAGGARS
jgi:thiosulfate reductase/polysulfide reductase chain A